MKPIEGGEEEIFLDTDPGDRDVVEGNDIAGDGEEDGEPSADAAAGSTARAPTPASAIESPPRDASPANSDPVEHDSGERSTETNNG